MASSISKAQADALASGFFDTIGESKEGLKPEHSLSALYQLAGGLVDKAQQNLNRADRVATGALSDSLKVLNPELVGRSVRIDIQALFYYQFVDAGVKGTKGGSGKYSFKNDSVERKMKEAIRKWLIREGIKSRTKTGGRPISKRESRRKGITDTSNQVAYAFARSIKQHGLKKTNFFLDAVKATTTESKEALAKGFKIDIINSIPNKI